MAAISITDCTVTALDVAGFKMAKIVTPSTADDGDTIDVSTIFSIGCFSIVSGATDNTLLQTAAEYADLSITLPGATDNEVRTILAFGE
jgi:hypothetical protein